MTISVIIPTYQRFEELRRCLQALASQMRAPDEVVVVVRDTDEETRGFLDRAKVNHPNLRIANVTTPGQVSALNAGLVEAKGDIIAFTDDDTVPHSDWLRLIEGHFQADPRIGAVGGRDWCYINNQLLGEKRLIVGKLFWFGLLMDNHHLGTGKPRQVDHLKGANMSFRKEALSGIRFDERLRGRGAQSRNDLGVCLAVKRRGWKIVYDPRIAVSHYIAKRYDEDQRGKFNNLATENMAFNETLVLLKHLSTIRKVFYVSWALFVGNRGTPGAILFMRDFFIRRKREYWERFPAALRGRWEAWKVWMSSRNHK